MTGIPFIILYLTLVSPLSLPAVVVTPGIMLEPPSGFYAYNFSPTLNSPDNNEIYDPNFIPGFRSGLTNTSLLFTTGQGYANIGYSIGPWRDLQVALPHMAVGPQCCNFVEVPRTQQFRTVEWGDFYYVRAGFASPAVNVPNFTAGFTAPAYVGLRTDWRWVVSISFDWKPPTLLDGRNEWAALGIVATQYVPNVPKKLVYTVVNFWMDPNSTNVLGKLTRSSSNGIIVGLREVVYPAVQLSQADEGNQTITLDLSNYLQDTLNTLGFANASAQPPVISYVYLNIEGYNLVWNTTLYSFFVMTDHSPSDVVTANYSELYYGVPLVCAIIGGLLLLKKMRRFRHTTSDH